jgi:hypothetical protein
MRPPSAPARHHRRIALAALLALVASIAAGCSSGGSTSGGRHSTTTAPATSSPSTGGVSSTTPPAGVAAPGTKLPASSSSGQQVVISATRAAHEGVIFGGPPGSWAVGFEVTNMGPGPFASDPPRQIVLLDRAGDSYVPLQIKTSPDSAPTTLASGQQMSMILVFVLPSSGQPAITELTPFAPSGPTLKWSAIPR